ncbi:MAG: hypothetical protein KTR31_33785 [Myxococcales bacterium]|nr:hypothetical protein [Myxococcales bacterium]
MRAVIWTVILWATLLALPFATLAAVDVAHGPAVHTASADRCTRACHDRGCAHLAQHVDTSRGVARLARRIYIANIEALRAPAFGYRDTNLLVYVLGLPLLFAGLLLAVLWPRGGTSPSRRAWIALALPVGLLGVLMAYVGANAGQLWLWGVGRDAVYWACTDFCIHAANLTGLTYEGFNFVLFVVGFPLTTVALIGLAARRWLGPRR